MFPLFVIHHCISRDFEVPASYLIFVENHPIPPRQDSHQSLISIQQRAISPDVYNLGVILHVFWCFCSDVCSAAVNHQHTSIELIVSSSIDFNTQRFHHADARIPIVVNLGTKKKRYDMFFTSSIALKYQSFRFSKRIALTLEANKLVTSWELCDDPLWMWTSNIQPIEKTYRENMTT